MIFVKDFFKKINNNKKVENIIFFIIVLIITIIIINSIWQKEDNVSNESIDEVLVSNNNNVKQELEERLENILETIKGVGKVNVFINYSESSMTVAMYDETTTTSTTQEGDSSGGTRNVTETQTERDVVFSEKSGNKEPVIQKTIMPQIKGAIITAEGGANATIKTNIISAVQAVTGLEANKVQVFEMK